MNTETKPRLREDQITLLREFEPFEKVLAESENSDLFCDAAFHNIHKIEKDVGKKIALIKLALKKDNFSSLGTTMFSYYIIEIIKQDRERGLNLLCDVIKTKEDEIDEHYISGEIGPLSEEEIRKMFSLFVEVQNKKFSSTEMIFPIKALFFLSKSCDKDYLPLFACLKEWLSDSKKSDFAIGLSREISKQLFDSKEDRIDEKKQFVDLVINDLNEKGIKVSNQFNPGMSKHAYAEYMGHLLLQYQLSEYHRDRICQGYTNHKEISSLLPHLQKQFEEGKFEHPLAGYFEYEKPVKEAIEKIKAAMDAEHDARNATWSLIGLWDMEDSIKSLQKQPGIMAEVRERLLNPPQFEDTLSELTVFKILNEIGRFELMKKEDRIEGILTFEKERINVEVAHPRMDSILEHGQGGGIHPFSKANIIKEKIEKIKGIPDGSKQPFLIIFDASQSNLDIHNVQNYLLGVQKFHYTVDKRTGETVDQGFFNDSKDIGLSEDDLKLVSAVVVYRRRITAVGIQYVAGVIPNPKAANQISEICLRTISPAFNKEIYCPLLRLF